jgi:hypothetical protein
VPGARALDQLNRQLPQAEERDREKLADAFLRKRPEPKTKEATARRSEIEQTTARLSATNRAGALAEDELAAAIQKRRAETLPGVRERRERARERVLSLLPELQAAMHDFDLAFMAETRLNQFPSPSRPAHWSRWLPAIRRPSGEALESSEVFTAISARFERFREPVDDSIDEPTTVDVRAIEEQFAGEPELAVDERPRSRRAAKWGRDLRDAASRS